MKKIVPLASLVFFTHFLEAQFDPKKISAKTETTYHGTIVFNDGSEWNCKFTYSPVVSEGVLLVKTDSMTYTLSPFMVRNFSFFDDEISLRRDFYALQGNGFMNSPAKYFFELIHAGEKISILGRNSVRVKRSNYIIALGPNMPARIKTQKVYKDYKKYLLDHRDGRVYPFSRQQFLDLIGNDIQTLNCMYKKHYKLHESDLEQYFELIDLHDKTAERSTE